MPVNESDVILWWLFPSNTWKKTDRVNTKHQWRTSKGSARLLVAIEVSLKFGQLQLWCNPVAERQALHLVRAKDWHENTSEIQAFRKLEETYGSTTRISEILQRIKTFRNCDLTFLLWCSLLCLRCISCHQKRRNVFFLFGYAFMSTVRAEKNKTDLVNFMFTHQSKDQLFSILLVRVPATAMLFLFCLFISFDKKYSFVTNVQLRLWKSSQTGPKKAQ